MPIAAALEALGSRSAAFQLANAGTVLDRLGKASMTSPAGNGAIHQLKRHSICPLAHLQSAIGNANAETIETVTMQYMKVAAQVVVSWASRSLTGPL